MLGFDPGALGLHHVDLSNSVTVTNEAGLTIARSDTVVGSLRLLSVTLPAWLWQQHRLAFILFIVVAAIVWALIGGALSRSTLIEAAQDEKITPVDAMRYVGRRWASYLLAPLSPVFIVVVCGLILAIAGFILFSFPVLDIVGGVFFFIAIALAMLMAFFVILWIPAVHLMYPCLSANGGDWFDAASRSMGYVLQRPWRTAIYYLSALVYGAATYMVLSIFIYLTLSLAQMCVGMWVLAESKSPEQVAMFDALFVPPQFDSLNGEPMVEHLGVTQKVAAYMVWFWVYVFVSILAAYAINFYFSSTAHIFLLLRRRCDGTDYSVVHIDVEPENYMPPAANAPQLNDPDQSVGEGGENASESKPNETQSDSSA